MSHGSHRSEAPRFLVLVAIGLAIAYGAPALLTAKLGLPLIFHYNYLLACARDQFRRARPTDF